MRTEVECSAVYSLNYSEISVKAFSPIRILPVYEIHDKV